MAFQDPDRDEKLGEIAYTVYKEKVDKNLPEWDDISENIKESWITAAIIIRETVLD